MDITPLIPEGRQVIDGYREDGFRIAGEWLSGSVLVLPAQTLDWSVERFEDIDADSFAQLQRLDEPVEILVLGCGAEFAFVAPKLKAAVKQRTGAVLEPMDTRAACRTYNVLLAEGRRVAAALLPLAAAA